MKKEEILNLLLEMHAENNRMKKLINKNTENILNLEMLEYIEKNRLQIKEVLQIFEETNYGIYKEIERVDKRHIENRSIKEGKDRLIEHNGEIMNITDWSRETGIPRQTIYRRLQLGWSIEDIINRPPRPRKESKTCTPHTIG